MTCGGSVAVRSARIARSCNAGAILATTSRSPSPVMVRSTMSAALTVRATSSSIAMPSFFAEAAARGEARDATFRSIPCLSKAPAKLVPTSPKPTSATEGVPVIARL
ncbi:hypothetical protein ACVWWG_005303 [Bradyrhizobium sp. LB7.2]